MEKSLNQPTLPHAIIAINATDMEVDPNEWNPEDATAALMESVAGAIHRDPEYRGLADYWIAKGRRIHTTQDLLECYYSSVTVVRIPIKGRYMKIDEQIDKLHKVVTRRCADSFRTKRRARMLSTAEELNIYLQCAFDHFSHDLDTPFNFMDVAFKINPIPLDFGGNILKLAVAVQKRKRYGDPCNIFRELGFMVASCILLDCARHGLKGKRFRHFCIPASLFAESLTLPMQDLRSKFWRKATWTIATVHWMTSAPSSGRVASPTNVANVSMSRKAIRKGIRMIAAPSSATVNINRTSPGRALPTIGSTSCMIA
jgi:hypothetical protein